MFIKKVGYLLLVRLKLFHLLAKLSPLAMLASLLAIFFLLPLKEEYKFQEPSLKTKLFDVSASYSAKEMSYDEVFTGIKVAQVRGVLQNECILVTFPAQNQQSQQIQNIFHTLANQKHLAKNAVLLSYSNQTQLYRFFQWFYDPSQNPNLSFGVIRAGLNIQIKAEQPEEEAKDKAYLKIYTSTLHADLDYFQASKELLQTMAIIWSPCQQIHKSPLLKHIKKVFTTAEELIRKERQLRLFYDHALCELSEHLHYEMSAHEIMMRNGFQAATVRFIVASAQQKVEKFVVSFVNEFGMQQDHLHSANNFYYPISKTYFAPLMVALYPSIIFFTALAVYLLDGYIRAGNKASLYFEWKVIGMGYAMISEYSITSDYQWSFYLAAIIFILSIAEDLLAIKKGTVQSEERGLYQIGLLAIQGLISIYFGVFCLALSYLAIIATLLMLIKPKRTILKSPLKISILLLICLVMNDGSFLSGISIMSGQLKLCLILPLLYYSL